VRRAARFGERLLKRVQVANHQIDRRNAVLLQRGHVFRIVAQGEDAA